MKSHLFFIALLFLFNTYCYANQSEMRVYDPELDDLTRYLEQDEIKYLSTQKADFLTLIKEQATGYPKGVAIFIPDIEQSITRQTALRSLHGDLNDFGWNSLLLTLPKIAVVKKENKAEGSDAAQDKSTPETPSSEKQSDVQTNTLTDTEEPEQLADNNSANSNNITEDGTQDISKSESNTNNEALLNPPVYDIYPRQVRKPYSEQYEKKVLAVITERLTSALDFAQSYPGFYLFVCQGRSCAWLMQAIEENDLVKPDVLVMLSAFVPQKELNNQLNHYIASADFPILDIAQQVDSPWLKSSLGERKKLVRKELKVDYRQRMLFSRVDYRLQNERTLKEVNGFLRYMGM